MGIAGGSGAGYHPNTGVESGHTSSVRRMSRDKVRTMLFSPKAFQVGVGRNGGVSGLRHAGKVDNEKAVDKAKSK